MAIDEERNILYFVYNINSATFALASYDLNGPIGSTMPQEILTFPGEQAGELEIDSEGNLYFAIPVPTKIIIRWDYGTKHVLLVHRAADICYGIHLQCNNAKTSIYFTERNNVFKRDLPQGNGNLLFTDSESLFNFRNIIVFEQYNYLIASSIYSSAIQIEKMDLDGKNVVKLQGKTEFLALISGNATIPPIPSTTSNNPSTTSDSTSSTGTDSLTTSTTSDTDSLTTSTTSDSSSTETTNQDTTTPTDGRSSSNVFVVSLLFLSFLLVL
jgi:hypothetical protein